MKIDCPRIVDESTELPDLGEGLDQLEIDMGGLATMNSVGIRAWIRWYGQLAKGKKIRVTHCPMFFIQLLSIVRGILPDTGVIDSFRLDYVSENTDETITHTIYRNSGTGRFFVPETLVSAKGDIYEFDGLIKKSLAALLSEIDIVQKVTLD